MQCRFSACGKFLHVVSLEARQEPLTKAERKSQGKASLQLSAFISTHRLSSRKTSRAPPTMIHRAKVHLGSTPRLCPTRMPVELTWTPGEVYLSSSSESNRLVVFRIGLFGTTVYDDGEPSTVSVPRKIILLPATARSRSVYYFPPKTGETHGLVLIGSWACKSESDKLHEDDEANEWDTVNALVEVASPPIGFYVHEEADLGGWGPSNAEAELSMDTDKGQLKQKMERFIPEDDCGDLETYFFA